MGNGLAAPDSASPQPISGGWIVIHQERTGHGHPAAHSVAGSCHRAAGHAVIALSGGEAKGRSRPGGQRGAGTAQSEQPSSVVLLARVPPATTMVSPPMTVVYRSAAWGRRIPAGPWLAAL